MFSVCRIRLRLLTAGLSIVGVLIFVVDASNPKPGHRDANGSIHSCIISVNQVRSADAQDAIKYAKWGRDAVAIPQRPRSDHVKAAVRRLEGRSTYDDVTAVTSKLDRAEHQADAVRRQFDSNVIAPLTSCNRLFARANL